VNRKELVCAINVWLAAIVVALAVVGWLHLLNPCLILISVFFLGVGFAFNAPTWTSIVPQVVSDKELPSAATLSGLQFNISGIIGPALGGLLVPLIGVNFVFVANAACFLLVVLAIRKWKQPTAPATLGRESLSESLGKMARYARSTPTFRIVLTRNFQFALFISAIPALVPVIGLQALHFSSSGLGLLFASMGAGSVAERCS
jgi:predicted MFS family arabinose efflux permease